jgi:F420-dependent oxidoreductase-like protein
MDVGLLIPQGWKGEYDGWDPGEAWARTVDLARQAEELGFESEWVFDHFTTVPEPTDEITFESFSTLSALAMVTERVRIGHMVVCTGFRNPALTAKLSSTIDVISGGRFELGIGAGWKEDEWLAYGGGFPPVKERLAQLGDHLEVIGRMLMPGRATYEGEYASVDGAINEPKGIQQPRIPIIVGGNGPNVTMRLAARFADELNLVFRPIEELPDLIAIARQRCEEIDRDPATLRLSLYVADQEVREPGQARVDLLGRLAEIGLDRIVAFPTRYGATRDVQAGFAEDCRAADLLRDVPAPAAVG